MKYKNSKKGETLIEVIAALTSIVLAGIAAVTVVLSVMTTTAISKEYLIAQNLAREAVESVVNYRNTNWLNLPANKTNCWMRNDLSKTTCTTSPELNVIRKETPYTMSRDLNGEISLSTTETAVLDLKGNQHDEITFSKYKLSVTDEDLYVHEALVPLKDPAPKPDFYRMIVFEKVNAGDSDDTFIEEQMKVTVTVQWLNKSTPKTYELNTVITNHEK